MFLQRTCVRTSAAGTHPGGRHIILELSDCVMREAQRTTFSEDEEQKTQKLLRVSFIATRMYAAQITIYETLCKCTEDHQYTSR